LSRFQSGKPMEDKDLKKEFYRIFKLREGYFITAILIYINIIIYLINGCWIRICSFSGQVIKMGANFRPSTNGEWYMTSDKYFSSRWFNAFAGMFDIICWYFIEPF
jgi:hypothetical protein